ncbi:unnamed protein product [Urochloa humidicola]
MATWRIPTRCPAPGRRPLPHDGRRQTQSSKPLPYALEPGTLVPASLVVKALSRPSKPLPPHFILRRPTVVVLRPQGFV